MRSLGGDEQLDEVHCLWALCSHPCCWEAEQRVTKGVYRRAVRGPTKHHTNAEERLPCLTLVDASEWAGSRTLRSDRTRLSRISSQAAPQRKDTRARFKTTDPLFPVITPEATKSHTGESGTGDKGAQIGAPIGSPWGTGSLVLWVPNPHYVPQGINSSESPHCMVKELLCLPAAQTPNTSRANRKQTTKVRRFQLTSSRFTFHPSQRAESVSPGDPESRSGDRSVGVEEREFLRDKRAFLVENKPVVLRSVHERRLRRASQDSPGSLYKLDCRTGEEVVDWDSLRGQSYLWKRHNVLPELLSAPGGARGTRESVGSSRVSKVSSGQTLHSPQCVAPGAWPWVKRTLCYSQYTDSLLHPNKYHRGTGSELDMTICNTSTVTKHSQLHRMLDTDERRETDRGSKDAVTPLNSEFYDQSSTHQLHCETHGGSKVTSELQS